MSAARRLPVVDDRPGAVRVRARTINVTRLAWRDLDAGRRAYPDEGWPRPRTLADCEAVGLGTTTPCPFVSCKHHLYLDVGANGSIKLNHPDREPDELADTCALRVAERGGCTLEETARVANLTRERVRQVENACLSALRDRLRAEDLRAEDFVDATPEPEGAYGGAVEEIAAEGRL